MIGWFSATRDSGGGGKGRGGGQVDHVTSRDGTRIAFEREGSGPAVILVGGGLDDGKENASLVPELAADFTVYNYARRGRGESGDTQPYALEREIDDLEALIAETGGPAHVYGVSSGGALALEAAAAGLAIERLGEYEVPYFVADEMTVRWQEYVDQLGIVLAEGRPGDALELFHRLTGFSEEDIAVARSSPYWPGAVAIEHTLAYDATCLGDGRPPSARLATIPRSTLVATGDADVWIVQAADAIAESLPRAERV